MCGKGRNVRFRDIVGDQKLPPSRFPGERARIDHLERGLCHVSLTSAKVDNESREAPLQQVEQEEPQFPIAQYYIGIKD